MHSINLCAGESVNYFPTMKSVRFRHQGVQLRSLLLPCGTLCEYVGMVDQIVGCFLHNKNPVIILFTVVFSYQENVTFSICDMIEAGVPL